MAGLGLNKGEKNNRKNPEDIEHIINEQTGDYKKIYRPHKLNMNITSKALMKYKLVCFKNGINQQDQLYEIFMNWLDQQEVEL